MGENEKNMQKIGDDELENVSGGYERRTPMDGFSKGFFRPRALLKFQKSPAVLDPSHAQEESSDFSGEADEEI